MSNQKNHLTREDLVDWLKNQKCVQVPIEGINITGRQIKFFNPATNRHSYVGTPINEMLVPDYVVLHICCELGIAFPDCVAHQESTFNDIKNTFRKNK